MATTVLCAFAATEALASALFNGYVLCAQKYSEKRGAESPAAEGSAGAGISVSPAAPGRELALVQETLSELGPHLVAGAFYTLCAMNVVPLGKWIGVALFAINAFAIAADQAYESAENPPPAEKRFPRVYRYLLPQALAFFVSRIPEGLVSGASLVATYALQSFSSAQQTMREELIPAIRGKIDAMKLPVSLPLIALGVHAIAGVIFCLARGNA